MDAYVPLQKNNEKVISTLSENMPKVFCDFPLIGTECYPFPVIVNSSLFDVMELRDGIMLGSSNNKELLVYYTEAYQQLLLGLAKEGYENLFLLCQIGSSEDEWLQSNILDELKRIYRTIPIVHTVDGSLDRIENEDGKANILFPFDGDNKVKGDIWELCNGLNLVNKKLPLKSETLKWITVVKEERFKLTISKILDTIIKIENLKQCKAILKESIDVIDWLNSLYLILNKKEELEIELARRKIVPNQNGDLCLETKLKRDDCISENLKDILLDLGEDIRSVLRYSQILIPEESNKECLTNADIALKIKTKVYEVLHQEDESASGRTEHIKKVFNKLILWFSTNTMEAKKIFMELYDRKYKLYDDEEIIENIKLSQEITKIMRDNSITGVEQIRRIIENSQTKEDITDVKLACMGITNDEEFELIFGNEDVKSHFTYTSKPTPESYNYVQKIIQRAKRNVLLYLQKYPEEYDCSLYQETATTVLAGIKKKGKPIKVVVRPSDGDKIYLFYQSELDTMDYEDYELWVDNDSNDPQRITFGKLLKITGVKIIPLRKIFY